MKFVLSDISITKGETVHTIPGRTFDSSTVHDVIEYIKSEIGTQLHDTEDQTAARVEDEQNQKLEDPVKAGSVDPPENEEEEEE